MTQLGTNLDEVMTLLADRLFVEADDPDLDLIDQGLIDSLGFTTLFALLEERFGVVVQLDDLNVDNFRTPRLIDQFIAGRVSR